MKKVFFILLFSTSILTYAQSVDFSGGYIPNGYGANVNYNKYFSPKFSYLQMGFDASFAKAINNDQSIPYSDLTLHIGYFYPLIQNKETTFQLATGAGVLTGYETINNRGEELLSNNHLIISKSSFVFGGYLSGELNILVSKNFYALLKYNQYYYLNTDLDPVSFYAGLGLRYYVGN